MSRMLRGGASGSTTTGSTTLTRVEMPRIPDVTRISERRCVTHVPSLRVLVHLGAVATPCALPSKARITSLPAASSYPVPLMIDGVAPTASLGSSCHVLYQRAEACLILCGGADSVSTQQMSSCGSSSASDPSITDSFAASWLPATAQLGASTVATISCLMTTKRQMH